jgi:hypothetical protein
MLPRTLSSGQYASMYVGMATVLLVGTWLVLLFTGASFDYRGLSKVRYFIGYVFSQDNPLRCLFIVLAALPFLSATIAIAYLRGVARTRRGAIVLLLCSLVVFLAMLVRPESVLTVVSLLMLPALFFGYRCVRVA